jgi:hypothetical protein
VACSYIAAPACQVEGNPPSRLAAGPPKTQLGEVDALEKVGELSLRRSQLTQAAAVFEQARAIYRRIDNSDRRS